MIESESPPPASSPTAADNTEVLSRRTLPGQGEVQEAAKTAPKVDSPAAEDMGEPTPMETGSEAKSNLAPN